MNSKFFLVSMAGVWTLTASLVFADSDQIKWFVAKNPFERKNGETHLEWAIEGRGGTVLFLDCQWGKIRFFDPGNLRTYECGDNLSYDPGQEIYSQALIPKDNVQWTNVRFVVAYNGQEKSFELGFNPVVNFTQDLYFGMKNNESVKKLQQFLTGVKLYSGPVNGNFLAMTLSAVKNFQKQNGIKSTGFVGKITRGVLNK